MLGDMCTARVLRAAPYAFKCNQINFVLTKKNSRNSFIRQIRERDFENHLANSPNGRITAVVIFSQTRLNPRPETNMSPTQAEKPTSKTAAALNVYLEIGKKRAFACAIDWPGWCRSGRDESAALQALFDVGPRYARILQSAGIDFQPPASLSAFTVVERLVGNATTDFGAPDMPSASDADPIDEAGLLRFQALLQAYWRAFDAACQAAQGKELRKGPRGGGRELEKIMQHVLEADGAYLSRLAWKLKKPSNARPDEALALTRQAVLQALAAAVRGELPLQGPRGGALWTPRRFIQRLAWHTLDHVWEIEERII